VSRAGDRVSSYRKGQSRWAAAFGCASVLLLTGVARAEERVQLAGVTGAGPEVEEVLVRAQAELYAVGFEVVSCPLEDSTGLCAPRAATGRLEVSQSEGHLLLKAWAQGEMAPLTQELDLGERGVSPEVAAIRAVELLRAMLLLSLREGNLRPEEGGSVEKFTAWEGEVPEEPAPNPEPVGEREPVLATPHPPVERTPDWVWAVGVGPAVSSPGGGLGPGWGGEFFVDAAFRSFYFGAAFDAVLLASSVSRLEGRTDVTSVSAIFRLGFSAPCGKRWVCRVGPHMGVLQFDLEANESPVFRGSDARHLTSVYGADAMVARYLTRAVGVFLRARLGFAGEAARLEVSTPVLLGRPVSGISLGVTFR
jgi:hypothetical protein